MDIGHSERSRRDESDSDYEDPLFGIQKRRKLRAPTQSKAPKMKQANIFDALKTQTSKRDALASELGFSIKENVPVSSLKAHKELGHVENKIERSKQVISAIEDHQQRIDGDKLIDIQAAEFVRKYVNSKFRKSIIEVDGKKIYENKDYLDKLQVQIKESIKMKDNSLIPSKNMFFIGKYQFDSDHKYDEYLRSQNPRYITNFGFSEKVILENLLKNLGCDIKALKRYPKKRFDNKNPLPDNFAIEILKFAQAVEYTESNADNRETIVKSTVLILLDENVQNDLNTVRFRRKEQTAIQLALYLFVQVSEVDDKAAVEYITNFCQKNPESWYIFLTRLCSGDETMTKNRHLLARLLLAYIAEVDCCDSLNLKVKLKYSDNYESASNEIGSGLASTLVNIVSVWSNFSILKNYESHLKLALNKIRCLERLFLLYYDLIKQSPHYTEKLAGSILLMKNQYFKNYSSSLSPIIPTVKSIFDFILKELERTNNTDFFATEVDKTAFSL